MTRKSSDIEINVICIEVDSKMRGCYLTKIPSCFFLEHVNSIENEFCCLRTLVSMALVRETQTVSREDLLHLREPKPVEFK